MKRMHVIARERKHLRVMQFPTLESGFWDVSAADAEKLKGGMLYLHEAKSKPSYFGGQVKSYRVIGNGKQFEGRVAFVLDSSTEGKGVAWEGVDHAMDWTGGVIDT